MNRNTARRISQAVSAPALIGVLACSAFLPGSAAADATSPAWLVSADVSTRPMKIVHGITVRPEAPTVVLPVQGYRLTARFGNSGGLWSSDHTGLDFAAPEGTALRAIGDGVVTEVGYEGAYGNKTVIRLDDGTELWYCHQSAQNVSVGDHVSAGDVIGAVGSTGNVTGPHLHLEVRPGGGDPVDPEIALADWGLNL